MTILAFAPRWNTPSKRDPDRHDATGGFQPWGKRFLTHHGQDPSSIILVDNHADPSEQMGLVLDVLAARAGKDEPSCVAFFCHGYKAGIQFGFKLRHLKRLSKAIAGIGDQAVKVPLYACDCGRDLDADRVDDLLAFGGDGGFADRLRDRLCEAGATFNRVDAHTSAGPASCNPNVRRFEGGGSATGGKGGAYIVPHGDPLWPKWRGALRSDYWYQFPFHSAAEIRNYLESLPG